MRAARGEKGMAGFSGAMRIHLCCQTVKIGGPAGWHYSMDVCAHGCLAQFDATLLATIEVCRNVVQKMWVISLIETDFL